MSTLSIDYYFTIYCFVCLNHCKLLPIISKGIGILLSKLYLSAFFLNFYLKMMSDNKQMMFILSGRADYIWNGDGIKYDHWVFNQKWMVITYIYFDNEYSIFVLTCYDNTQGYNKLTIHPYMKPSHIIMSKFSDKLFCTIIQTLNVKPLQPLKYSIFFKCTSKR